MRRTSSLEVAMDKVRKAPTKMEVVKALETLQAFGRFGVAEQSQSGGPSERAIPKRQV
jgi:hypothetical protein